jgi:hypothetical protein
MTCPLEIQPFDQSKAVRTPQLTSLNYTNQDYFSLKNRLRDIIRQKFPNDFNDLIESSIAIMLVELWAFIADLLSFKMDQNVNEVYLDTVTEVENAFRLARLVGFQPTPPIAARAMFEATINNVLATDLVIPGGLDFRVVSDNKQITYEIFPADANNNPVYNEDIIIPAGKLTNTQIIGVEGRTDRAVFNGNGEAGQSLLLPFNPVIYESIRVNVDGIRWNRVDYFTDSQPRREFRVEFDSDYRAFIIFGDNTAGMIPSNGSRIEVIYRIGGGTIGNIITGFINIQRNVSLGGFDFSIPVSFFNYTKGEFGYDGDDLPAIRRKLPAWLRAQDRCVTGEDYKTISDLFVTPYHGQIGKSTAVLRNYGCAANIIDLYILALDGNLGLQRANDDLKFDLQVALEDKKMLTDYVCLRDGTILPVDMVLDITIDKFYKKLKEELNVKVKNKVDEFFALERWEYGQSLRDTDLIKFLSDIKEITHIDVTYTTDDPDNSGSIVTAKFNEIIRPDTVSINLTFE